MVEFFENNPVLISVFIFIAGIILSIIGFLLKKLFINNKNGSFIKAGGNIEAGGDITVGDKNTKIINVNSEKISKKNPFIVLYVRNIKKLHSRADTGDGKEMGYNRCYCHG